MHELNSVAMYDMHDEWLFYCRLVFTLECYMIYSITYHIGQNLFNYSLCHPRGITLSFAIVASMHVLATSRRATHKHDSQLLVGAMESSTRKTEAQDCLANSLLSNRRTKTLANAHPRCEPCSL